MIELNNINWGGSGIEKCLYDFLINKFPKGTKMLEFGGGNVSTNVFSDYFNLTTVEEDLKWLNIFKNRYIYAPIKNNWYDNEILSKELDNDYQVIFVDGPLGGGNRFGLLNNLHLFNENITWVFHDTYRITEKKLAAEFSEKTNKKITFYSECDYWAVVE